MDKRALTANHYPHLKNYCSRLFRAFLSHAPTVGLTERPTRPVGISMIMRIKNEMDWIRPSVESIRYFADEILIVDNGSTDGTYEILEEMALAGKGLIKLWRRPQLDLCDLSNFALAQTQFRWVFRWDGDMVAHTSGKYAISKLRDRILSLDARRYYLIYLRHINLSGDLFHQDSKEMVHIEEYIHTYSAQARYIHPGRFEAIDIPKYFRIIFWYEPYAFHVDVKPAKRMLLRYFWEDWMELKDYQRFPALEDYVKLSIEGEFGTKLWKEAERICIQQTFRDHIRYDSELFGTYPELLQPYLNEQRYSLIYHNDKIVGREEG
jgi:glycosyltransferase involved in cell wall biosynthesis